MSDATRRDVLAGAAGLISSSILPKPAMGAARAPATSLPFIPSALLLEHRRRIVPVLALKAIDPFDELLAMDAAGLLPTAMTPEEIEAIAEPPQARHRARIDAHMPALVTRHLGDAGEIVGRPRCARRARGLLESSPKR